MLSDLQQKKYTRLFQVRDVDKNGVVEHLDYEQLGWNLAEAGGWLPGSIEYEDVLNKSLRMWTTFWKPADYNDDGQVTLTEFLEAATKLVQRIAEGDEEAIDVLKAKNETLFKVLDADGDEKITAEEYKLYFKCCALEDDLAEAMFSKLDLGGNGYIAKEAFMQLCDQFYLGDDPQASGNWLFGEFE